MAVNVDELVDAALRLDLVTSNQIQDLRIRSRRTRIDLLELLAAKGRFPLAMLYQAVAEERDIEFVDLSSVDIDPKLVARLPQTVVRRRQVLPIEARADYVVVATSDPTDRGLMRVLERSLGVSVEPAMADPGSLQRAIDLALGDDPVGLSTVSVVGVESGSEAVPLLNSVLSQAFLTRASDVHLDPQPDALHIRLRIDGQLRTLMRVPVASGNSLISRVKVLADMDIAEQRAPQDGSFSHTPSNVDQEFDIRAATLPSVQGEKVTMRLLGHETDGLRLDRIGMSADRRREFRQHISRPHGMILLTGPTGSGKSTTLYAALREIQASKINIMTVEDPVEYRIPGITQVQVGQAQKVGFASALRSIVRHDPDVIMVGEIRDRDTADVCLRAALTGHLVFSTLHTNDACGAVPRLLELGVERYLVASTMCAVIAQRLVRRLCTRCRVERPVLEHEVALLRGAKTCFEASGCARCDGTGFRGRVGVFECLWVDAALATEIHRGAGASELAAKAGDRLTLLEDDAVDKIKQGLTTIQEVQRIALLRGEALA